MSPPFIPTIGPTIAGIKANVDVTVTVCTIFSFAFVSSDIGSHLFLEEPSRNKLIIA